MRLLNQFNILPEWVTKLSAAMGAHGRPPAAQGQKQHLRLVSNSSTAGLPNEDRKAEAAVKALLKTLPDRGTPLPPEPRKNTKPPPGAPPIQLPVLTQREKLKALFNPKSESGRMVYTEIGKGLLIGGTTFGLKKLGMITAHMIPGGIMVVAGFGALVGIGTTAIHMWAKGEFKSKNESKRKIALKLLFSAVSGGAGAAIGMDAAEGFDTLKSIGNKVQEYLPGSDKLTAIWQKLSTFGNPTKNVVLDLARTAGAASTPVLQAASEVAQTIVTSRINIDTIRDLSYIEYARTRLQSNRELVEKACAQAAEAIEKAQQSARAAANAAQEARVQVLQAEWNNVRARLVTAVDIPAPPDPSSIPGTTLVEGAPTPTPDAAPRAALPRGGITPPALALSPSPLSSDLSAGMSDPDVLASANVHLNTPPPAPKLPAAAGEASATMATIGGLSISGHPGTVAEALNTMTRPIGAEGDFKAAVLTAAAATEENGATQVAGAAPATAAFTPQ